MAANASVQMLKTLYAAARQPVPAVFQRTPKLTIYFFVAVNLITALRFGLPQVRGCVSVRLVSKQWCCLCTGLARRRDVS